MRLSIRATLLAATCLAAASPALAQEIGTAGAVNPASTGTPPTRPTRVLELGARVVHKERINTAAGGNVQLVFNDKTTMSIGPNSQVVIDEFVYDPNAGTGRLTASIAKGVLRFVGGNTSHSGGAEIKTPSATLGIRGGVATIEIVPCGAGATECGTKVTNHFGILSVTSAAGTEIIRRPGFVVSIPNASSAPTSPRKVTQAEVNRTNATLTSKPGQTGGAGARASEVAVDRANVAGPLIAQIGTSVASIQGQTQAREASAANTLGLSVAPTDATTPTQIRQIANNTQQQVTAQNTQVQTAAAGGNQDNPIVRPVDPVDPVTPVTPVTPPPTGVASPQAFALAYTGPQSPASLVPGATYNSPVLGYVDGGTTNGRANTTARTLQAGLGISGSGAAQSSTLYVVVGSSFVADSGTPVANGGFTGIQRASGSALPTRVSGGIVGSGADVLLDGQYAPTRLTGRAGSVSDQGIVTSETGSIVRYPGPATTSFSYQIGQARTDTPGGLGLNRPVLDSVPNPLFGGLAAGLTTTVNNTTGAVGPTSILTGLFDLTFSPATSQFGTTLGVNASNADGNGLSYAYLDYGKPVDSFYSRPETRDGRGTYIDANTYGAREATSPSGAFTSEVNGSTVREHRGVFVTSDAVNAKSFFPGVSFCQCDYTRWGFWSSETTRVNAAGQSVTDLTHLGTWVFGDPTRDLAVPTTGTATYAGHAIASIRNGAAEYVAAGNFQNVVNFGTGTGAASVTGLDGRNYAGTVSLGQGSNFINGSLASSVAGSTMAMSGQFFRGASGPAGEMGGTVTVGGTPGYVASGIFAGAAAAPR